MNPAPDNRLPNRLALAFAPLHKRALGVAVGTASGLVLFAATTMYLLRSSVYPFDIELLAQYFFGYRATWWGAFVGLAWGFAVGFVAGWFLAFCRNLFLATTIFIVRTRAELAAGRDFLDHI